MKILFLFFLGILLFPSFLIAQSDTSDFILNEVVVQDNRIQMPFAEQSRTFQIISKTEIAKAPAQSVPEILQHYAGLDIRQRGAHGVQADVSIRGGTFDQVLILVNGIKMSDPQTGHHALNIPIDLASIERIEVLKGPAARIYGQGALAGAINIVTRVPEENAFRIGVTAGMHQLGNLRVSTALPGKHMDQYFAVSRQFSEGYRYNTDYDISNYFYQATLGKNNRPWNLLASFTEREFGANRFYGNDSDAFADQYEEVQTSLVALSYKHRTDHWVLRPRISWRRNQDEYIFNRSNPSLYRNLHISDVLTAELHTDYYSKAGETGMGVELSNLRLRSNNLGQRERQSVVLFLEHRFHLLDQQLDITPGISAAYYSDFGEQFMPGLEAGYQIHRHWKVYGNLGYTWRIPTFTDLYYEDAANLGNADLQPESALSYELGMKYNQQAWSLQASAFLRDGRDLIDWGKTAESDLWQPRNMSDLQMRGLEVSTSFDFQQLLPGSFLQQLRLSYTFIDSELPEITADGVNQSRYVLENLRHQLNASLDHQIIASLFSHLRYRFLDRVSLDSYHLVDWKWSWQAPRYTVFLLANNITNTSYRESNLVEMPGTWVMGGIDFNF